VSPWRVHSLPFDIPRLLLMSMENVPRMVNPLYASIPRGIDIHGKAVHGHSYTVWHYNATPLIPVQSTRPSHSPLETRTATDSVFTGARNNSLSASSSPSFTQTISSQRELRHESPWEHLFARRPRNSRRFSTFVVGHTWLRLDIAPQPVIVRPIPLLSPTNGHGEWD